MAPPAGRFTCVVDDHPRFHLDALRWFACLTEVVGVDPGELVVHVVGASHTGPLDFLAGRGVAVRTVDRFDPRSAHCNKIAGALELADRGVRGMAVLCDTDVVVLEDPRRLDVPGDAVAAKPVDAPVPPVPVLARIFEAAGLPVPPTKPLPWGAGDRTVSGNSNGGLYLIPGTALSKVSEAWARWAGWLLDRAELLEEWTVHVDQVAMAIGLAAEQVGSLPLDVRWNTPTHDLSRIPPDPPTPAVIHYHQLVDEWGLIMATGAPAIDKRIEVANRAIARVWADAAPEETHRRWLALQTPPPGPAGTPNGSQAPQSAASTARDRIVAILQPTAVHEAAPGQRPPPTELVVCLDPPGGPVDTEPPAERLARLWPSCGRALVVTGPGSSGGDAPEAGGPEPLSAVVERLAPEAEAYPVARVGDRATFLLLRPPTHTHPRDYTPATLRPLAARLPDPLDLVELRLAARQSTGFYPDHSPRLWEYPVVARLLADELPTGSRLVDVGAGVTPLAPFLTTRGFVVDTVDPSPTRREWPPRPDWNEWDYLDYGRAGLAHRSWNCTLDQLPLQPPFDGAYSVSVIEHVPAAARRSLLRDMAVRVRAGGLVVLTIDLVRGTNDLWNRSRGEEVEEAAVHGTFDDVVAEAAAVGLELFRRDAVRAWGDVHVDIGLAAFHRTEMAVTQPRSGLVRSMARRLRR